MKIHITEQEKRIIQDIFSQFKENFDVYIFGSRARGDHKKYSDLDVCLKGLVKVPSKIFSNLKNSFQESNLPYTVDIVDWNDISKDFQKKIQNDLIHFER